MKTIRVTGKGKLKVHPDMTRITMTLGGLRPEYGEALKRSAEDTEALKALLEPFGFEKTKLKTLSFGVDPEYESYQEKKAWKQRLLGYRFRHVMKLEFASDNERLGKVLYALANNKKVTPEFRISYTVRDPEAAKNELLAAAVRDSQVKAKVLSDAAGAVLKDLKSIDYSWGEIDFEVSPMNRFEAKMMVCEDQTEYGSYDLDIEPDDIEVTDTVTVVWELGQDPACRCD